MLNKKLTTLFVAIALTGCVTSPTAPPAIVFNYKTQNAGAVGIVQVFDMAGNTVVQIKNLQDKAPLFLNEGNTEIKYQVVGQTAVLEGIQKSFNVVNAGAWAHVTRQSDAPMPQAIIAAAAKPAPQSSTAVGTTKSPDEDLREQIIAMRKEIASLKGFIKSKTDGEAPEAAESPAIVPAVAKRPTYAPIANVKESTSLRVTFKNNSAEFNPRTSLAKTILDLARDASEISVTGYTDGTSPTPNSAQLAKSRALAARQFLVSNGIDRSKIAVAFQSYGGFVADNSTKDGRDRNRRVEIEIL